MVRIADGSVRIDVGLDTSKAEKDLDKLKHKIAKLETELSKDSATKDGLLKNLAEVSARLDDATERVRYLKDAIKGATGEKKSLLKEELEEALAEQRGLNSEATKLNNQYDRLKERIGKNTEQLREMKEEAGNLTRNIERARPAAALASSFENAKAKMIGFVKAAVGIATVAALFKKLRDYTASAIRAFAEGDAETKANIESLRNALAALKASWGAAFAPIINAIIPILQKLISWLTTAANAVARFFAIIGGKTTYKKAIANTAGVAEGIDGIGGAAEETAAELEEVNKQLLGFDELNILTDLKKDNSNANKGSGGGGKGSGPDGYTFQEESVDALDGSFLSRLALAVKDVFFDWGDWTAEKILAKAIAFIPAAAGAYLGWNIGGFKGAVIGGIAGLLLGLVIDANTFNFDGKLSSDEIIKLAIQAIPAIAGLIVGWASANPILGIAVGLALSFFLNRSLSKGDGTLTSEYVIRAAIELIPALAGLLVGFLSMNPVLGIGVYLALRFAVSSLEPAEKGVTKETWFDKIRESLHFPSDQEIIDWVKDIFWEKGIKKFFAGLYGLFSGGELSIETPDSWISAIRDAINFPEGMDIWEWCYQFFWEDGVKAFFVDLKTLIFGWSGAYDAGEALSDKTAEGMGTIDGKLSTWWDEHVKPWFTVEKWRQLGQDAMASIRNGLNSISLPKFHFYWETTGYTGTFFGRTFTVNIPFPHLDWYARGGIFDSASVIGVGENGKEAVVPLEKNTEWITLVADGLIERLTRGSFADQLAHAFATTPMPAMASGAVVPPGATTSAFGSEWGNSLMEEIKSLRSEISALASQPVQVNSKVMIDKRQVGTAVTEFQRDTARAHGG